MQSPHFWPAMLKLAGLIIIYYVPSIGLTFYQGWLIKELKFPITIVLAHFIMKVQTPDLATGLFSNTDLLLPLALPGLDLQGGLHLLHWAGHGYIRWGW